MNRANVPSRVCTSMPSAIRRITISMGKPWKTGNSNLVSSSGVSTRSVNCFPWMGTMLKVGFSAALTPTFSPRSLNGPKIAAFVGSGTSPRYSTLQ